MKTFSILATLLAASVSASPLERRDNLDSPATSSPLVKRYVSGSCGLHVKQYQKTEPNSNPGPNYLFDISIFDASGAPIGGVQRANAPAFQGVAVSSQLPYLVILTAQNVDQDPVLFDYAAQHWASTDANHCSFGRYDSGARQGDCGFTC